MTPSDPISGAADRQKEHYEAIHDEYQQYYDAESMAYRERFIYAPLLAGLDLADRDVADLACGSGATSLSILRRFPRARLYGFDVSARACADYQAAVGRPAFQVDLTRPVDVGRTFHTAVIIGGLHHCVADLEGTMATIHGLLEPGGLLLMMEPSDDFVLAGLRRLWYRWDRYFDSDTEQALSHARILAMAAPGFSLVDVRYLGGPGYFLVLNSLVFRLPRGVKRRLTPPLLAAEAAYNRLPGSRLFPYFVARWRRQ